MNTKTLQPVDHLILGEAAEVANVLACAQRRGELLACSAPRATGDGRIIVDVTLLSTASQPGRSHRHRPVLIGTGITVAAAIVGVLVWLVVSVLAWIAAHLAMILGAAVVLLVLLGMLAGSGKCPGLHCPGCGE